MKKLVIDVAQKKFTYGILLGSTVFLLAIDLLYGMLSADQLKWLLYPTSKMVELFVGTESTWVVQKGYLLSFHPILIEKSCSGFLFLGALFCLTAITVILGKVEIEKFKFQLFLLPLLLILFVVLVNAFRIITSIGLESFSDRHSWFPNHLLHEVFGAFYFLGGSYVVYISIVKYFNLKSLSWKF